MRLREWLAGEENGRREIVPTAVEIAHEVDGRAAVAAAEEVVAGDADRAAAADAVATAVVMAARGTKNWPRIFTNSHRSINLNLKAATRVGAFFDL
jgi:hypothetical protein